MCEPTMPINELRQLARDVYEIAGERSYAATGYQQRLHWVIRQLEVAGEGEKTFDLDAIEKSKE